MKDAYVSEYLLRTFSFTSENNKRQGQKDTLKHREIVQTKYISVVLACDENQKTMITSHDSLSEEKLVCNYHALRMV